MTRPSRYIHRHATLPPKLRRLRELAYNFWWSWDQEASDLFRQLAPDLWEITGRNPALMLGTVSQRRLQELASDKEFLLNLEHICGRFDEYMGNKDTWYERFYGARGEICIAYFSAEFGLTGCLPIYSGGLGILAGDHLKSASDLGLPLVGVGLLYQEGYFHQYLRRDGRQGELFPSNDFHNMPIQLQRQEDGAPVTIEVTYSDHEVTAHVWRAQVGHVPLYLLDTNLPANSALDRQVTNRLYGGDLAMRIRQEVVLGIGGMRALNAMGVLPKVCHMNEGHAAFAALERIRIMMSQHSLSFADARKLASASNIFTTHTSLPASIDKFPPKLMDKYFCDYHPLLGLSWDDFLALGRWNAMDKSEPFCMPILALRLAGRANGVSKLHSEVSRRLWRNVWSNLSEDQVPITSVTNGIHLLSWISGDIASLLNRYLGQRWQDSLTPDVWQKIDSIPEEELWRAHEQCRERLIAMARQRLRVQLQQQGVLPREIKMADEVLDPKALTVGFARRFTEYKRPTLILRDPERLVRLLTNRDCPIQIILAGKSHPNDKFGKDLIQQIARFVKRKRLRRQIVFLEDYDMTMARYLIQGADIWLNTPRPPSEACGTSGMKAATNGNLNISVLDGWWAEVYQPDIGWAIGRGEEYEDPEYQDEVESQAIYDILEREVIPLFYDRGDDGLPRAWIKQMKATMQAVCPRFNTGRMVREYCEHFYTPAAEQYQHLAMITLSR